MIDPLSPELYTTALPSDKDAPVPYPRPIRTPVTMFRQYSILLQTLLSSYRADWFLHIFMGLIVPLTLIFLMKAAIGSISVDRAIFLLGGNMAMSIAFGPTQFLITKLGWAHQSKEFEYWIALPVPKLSLVLAIITVSLLFALPGLLGSYILGCLVLGLPLSGGWALIPLIPLAVLPLAGVGAFLGTLAPNGQAANLMGNLMIVVVSFLSPMLISPEALPVPLRFISWLIPTTYVADAFRAVLHGNLGASFGIDVIVLICCSVVLLSLANWKIEWRTV